MDKAYIDYKNTAWRRDRLLKIFLKKWREICQIYGKKKESS